MRFEKITKESFDKHIVGANDIWEDIILPSRSTSGSAGYDFHMICDVCVEPGETIKIPTGIKAQIDSGYVLFVLPRSSVGIKLHCRLANSVGVIDSDYYNNPDNEGDIIVAIHNYGDDFVSLKKGDRFAQGIFLPFGITDDDSPREQKRTGGIGSSGR